MTAVPTPADYQYEIYLAGLAGQRPALPADLTRLEELARQRLPEAPFGYVAGGAASEATVKANRAAFDRLRLVPRMLRDVAARRTERYLRRLLAGQIVENVLRLPHDLRMLVGQ